MDIVLENVCKSYNDKQVLDNLTYTFKDKTITCIMGKSGIGKTTLLNILMKLETKDSGKILGLEKAKMSAVFQENRLCENLNAILNIKLVTNKNVEEIKEKLEMIGITAGDFKPVSEYSGGMKRRVAIVRALMSDYDLLLMDEPLKGLDEDTKLKVIKLICDMTKSKTVIIVTHDEDESVLFHADIMKL